MLRFGWAGTIPFAEDALRATTVLVLGLLLAATFATSFGMAIAAVIAFTAAIPLTLWLAWRLLDLSRFCAAPLNTYCAAKEMSHEHRQDG
jgi:hypothetical protein